MKNINFTSHQPYLEMNTYYYRIRPATTSPIAQVVWEVYQVNHYDYKKKLAFPDACADLMIFYMENDAVAYVLSGGLELHSMEDMEFLKHVHTIFGVRFLTGKLGNLFSQEIRDAGGNRIFAQDAFPNGADMVKKLIEAESFSERWIIVEDYLEKRLQTDYEKNLIVSYVTQKIMENPGKTRVKNLEEETGYSARYLRKLVDNDLGVSIKQLCEVTQFQWAYHLYHQSQGNISFIDLAMQSGYYDQSHMNNSFKKLTGQLPRKVMNLYRNE